MLQNIVLVVPKYKKDENGYYYAKFYKGTIDTKDKYISLQNEWLSDCFHIYGSVHADFQNNGNIIFFADDNELIVKQAYETRIYGGKETCEKYLKGESII